MPRYELCYLLSSQVSDDMVPSVTEQIKKFVTDFGGTDLVEQQLGKKKLAYPIKKTKNGFYVVDTFNMDSNKINEFDAKIRSQTATIIRYLIVNLDEHLARSEKDKVAQSKLSKQPEGDESNQTPETESTSKVKAKAEGEEAVTEAKEPKVKVEISETELDKKIEEALNQQV